MATVRLQTSTWSGGALPPTIQSSIVHGIAEIQVNSFGAGNNDDQTLTAFSKGPNGFISYFRNGDIHFYGGPAISVPNQDGLMHTYGWQFHIPSRNVKFTFDGAQVGNPGGYTAPAIAWGDMLYIGDGSGGNAHSEVWDRYVVAEGNLLPLPGVIFADDFDQDTPGPLTGQTADTGQTWSSWDWPGWSSPNSLVVGTAYGDGESGSNGAGTTSGSANTGNTVFFGAKLTENRYRLDMDIRADTTGGAPQFWLRDSDTGSTASIQWNNGTISFEGMNLTGAANVAAGFSTGILHLMVDIDLDEKIIAYGWYDANDPSEPTTSGQAIVGSYAPWGAFFEPDALHLWRNQGGAGAAIGYDDIRLWRVPEPGSLTLLALWLGLLALCGWRRR